MIENKVNIIIEADIKTAKKNINISQSDESCIKQTLCLLCTKYSNFGYFLISLITVYVGSF